MRTSTASRSVLIPMAVLLTGAIGLSSVAFAKEDAQQTAGAAMEAETLQHFQALLRIDTSSPPGNETRAVEYLQQVFEKVGVPYQIFAKNPARANIVARLKGNGKKRPILILGHTDVVTVDPAKWTHPPFGADRDGGYIYGRGTVDDKDNLVAGLMVLPTMGTGATDMAQIRSKGIQCYGIGPALDSEDSGKGFGAHSDQERILESELHRFVRFQYDVVLELARAR
ncbi:MAG: M20/M25/M40 family metallo-hydrolase [Vicinamibacterales bacterium]